MNNLAILLSYQVLRYFNLLAMVPHLRNVKEMANIFIVALMCYYIMRMTCLIMTNRL